MGAIFGTSGPDVLNGTSADDTIYGNDGNDTLYGKAGNDTIYAGEGNNTIDAGTGNNRIYAGNGNDTYHIYSRNDYIYDSGGTDSGTIYVDFYKPNGTIENWSWAPGVQHLPYWIDSLLPADAPIYPVLLGSGKTFLYCFPTTLPSQFGSDDGTGFTAFNQQQKDFVRQALTYISSVIDVQFTETADSSGLNTLVFANNTQEDSAGYAYYPYDSAIGSDILIGMNGSNLTPADGLYSALTFIHEIGHALGLKHPFQTSDSVGTTADSPYLPTAEDSTQWTVMSYESRFSEYHLKYSPFDIAALQYLYGPSTAVATDDVYVPSASATNFIWDGGGTDSIDASSLSTAVTIYLQPGYQGYIGAETELISQAGQITVNFGTVIENALGGSKDDFITGNDADNDLYGNGGDDTLQGGAGSDYYNGGEGDDTASFTGAHADYTVMRTATGFRVSANGDSDDVDEIYDVEHLQFDDGTIDLEYSDAVQELYVAYFGRAADTGGLANFSAALAAAGAPVDISGLNAAYKTNASVKSLIDAFGTSNESKALYTGDSEAFVTSVFTNVLNRAPQQAGLDFWSDALDSGALTQGNAALAIMNGALTNTTAQGLIDAALVNNKIRIASNFTFAIDNALEVNGYKGATAAATVRSMLSTVTSTTDNDAFQATITSTLSSLSSSGGVVSGSAPHGVMAAPVEISLVGISFSDHSHAAG